MEYFIYFIEFLVGISVIVSGMRIYLKINKLWKRKDVKVVAESISVFEKFLGVLIGIPFFIKFTFLEFSLSPAVNEFLALVGGIIIFLIGTGIWVRGGKEKKFRDFLLNSIRKEKKESGDLVKAFFAPQGADKIIKILEKLSAIDSEIALEEIKIIEEFSKEWNLTPPKLEVGVVDQKGEFQELRNLVVDYLNINPPFKQAWQMLDILKLMINADSTITKEEELIFAELTCLINNYINDSNVLLFEVLIVPQTKEEFLFAKELLPEADEVNRRGGKAILVGRFYTKSYAEEICKKYIDLDLFTVWEFY